MRARATQGSGDGPLMGGYLGPRLAPGKPRKLAVMSGNPPGPPDILGVPIPVVVLGLAIVGFVVGTVWLWRVTHEHRDGDDPWRFRR